MYPNNYHVFDNLNVCSCFALCFKTVNILYNKLQSFFIYHFMNKSLRKFND